MEIENKHDAPASFIKFCRDDNYSSGDCDFSATQLIDEPRIVQLNKRHSNQIVEDPYENPWKFVSTIFHSLMEGSSPDDEIAEERLFGDIDGVRISGAMDVQVGPKDGITIGDYKMTTVFGIKDTKKFEQQLNIYAWLIEKSTARKVKDLKIYAFLRDWKISMSERIRDSPATPGITLPLDLWTFEEREHFIRDRISIHRACQELTDDELPPCSHEGRWPGGSLFTVSSIDTEDIKFFDRKSDAKKYIEALDTAEQFCSVIGKTFEDYRRCKSYCAFSDSCNIYKGFKDDRKNLRGR